MSEEAKEVEKAEGEEVKTPLYEIELTDDVLAEVEKSVLESNSGKAKDELTEEIEAAKAARLEEAKKESEKVLSKMEELSELEENKDKTDEELMELASTAIAESSEEGDSEEDENLLGDDFFGKGAREVATVVKDDKGEDIKGANLSPEIQTKLERLEKLEKDEFLKTILDGEDTNVKRKFAQEIAKSGWAFDINSVDPYALKAEELRRLKEQNPNAISDDEIAEELEDFKSKTNLEKIRETTSFKAQLVAEQEKFFDSLGDKVSSDVNASKVQFTKIVTEAEAALKEQYLGNVFFGINVDEEQTTKVMNAIRSNGVTSKKADGTPNLKEAIEKELMWLNRFEIIETAQKRMLKKETRKQTIKQGKPLAGIKVRSAKPKNNTVSREAKLREAQKLANMI